MFVANSLCPNRNWKEIMSKGGSGGKTTLVKELEEGDWRDFGIVVMIFFFAVCCVVGCFCVGRFCYL